MYSLDEINEALEKERLSDALYKMERFAKEQGLKDLATWCSWELNGYPSDHGQSDIKYRFVGVQWRDVYNRPMVIPPKFAFIQKLPVWIGVSELEGYVDEGFGYSVPEFSEMLSQFSNVPVGSAGVSSATVRGLLDRVRLQARSRLHDSIPRIPKSKLIYPAPNFTSFAADSFLGEPEMGHVLFVDVVGYSKLPMDQQTLTLKQLQDSVSRNGEFQRAHAEGTLISLPTGDGMALVFFRGLTVHVQCALELAQALTGHPELKLRMGLHSGPVYRVLDINTNRNVSGGGINVAQRVMDCGDAGHILMSKSVADVLRQLGRWEGKLRDLGEVEVKHGELIRIYNLVDGDLGSPATPSKVEAQGRTETSSSVPIAGGRPFSDEEAELLACAAGDGEIVVMSTDETSDWVRAGGRDFFNESDRAVAAAYLEALDSLRLRGLVKHSGGILYELTGTGFKQARALKQAREQ